MGDFLLTNFTKLQDVGNLPEDGDSNYPMLIVLILSVGTVLYLNYRRVRKK